MKTIFAPAMCPAAMLRRANPVRQRERAKSHFWALLEVTLYALLILPNAGRAQVSEPDDLLQQQWLEIQAGDDRQMRKGWWQQLDLDQLNDFVVADVELNVSDHRGWTPLHSAARYNGDPNVLLALVNAGAVVDAKDRSGDTPLHWAAAENANVDVVTSLISAGADVNARDRYGWLPIHTAADRNPNPEILDALLAAGAQHHKRAYFVFFRPVFLLKHNANMSDSDKKTALALLKEAD